MRSTLAAALVAALAVAPGPSAAAPEAAHPVAEDLVRLRSISEPRISPDGTRAAFLVSGAAFDSSAKPADEDLHGGWTRERQLWLVDLATRSARALTTGDAMVSGPAFSPDGRSIAFVRAHGGHDALHVLPLAGGEPRVVPTGALEPAAPAFPPDGATIAFLAQPALTDSARRARFARGQAEHWEREWPETRLHVVPASGGAVRELTRGRNVIAFAWSPDGRRFVVQTSDSGDPYQVSSLTRLAILDAATGATLVALEGAPASYGDVAWSPDGRSVAALGTNGGLSNTNAVWVWDAGSGARRDIAPGRDHTWGSLAWSGDSRSLLVVERARTTSAMWRLPLAGPAASVTFAGLEGRVVTDALRPDASARHVLFLSSTSRSPAELTLADVETGRSRVVTDTNPQVAAWALGTMRVVRWTNAEGTALEGLLTVSPAARPGVPARLLVMPHGGPDEVSDQRFSPLAQYFASRGYSVFQPNYRGGLGYGFAHYAANRNRFGEIEQADIESGVDALVRSGDADSTSLYYGGWSWGGYLTCWTITHVHRYRAAVAGAAVSDVMHSYSLSDINHGVAAQWEFEGDPWSQLAHFDRPNPIRYVKDCTTPLLILHGEADTRVPFAESVELYRALADLGREVEFWAYPRENHGFVEPAHLVHRARAWADWYDAH